MHQYSIRLQNLGNWLMVKASDSGKVVHTHTCASLTKQYDLVVSKQQWCSVARKVTAGLSESNFSLPAGLWLCWLPIYPDQHQMITTRLPFLEQLLIFPACINLQSSTSLFPLHFCTNVAVVFANSCVYFQQEPCRYSTLDSVYYNLAVLILAVFFFRIHFCSNVETHFLCLGSLYLFCCSL